MLERALSANFDERLSLVSLLLAGLNVRFAAARETDAVTDACYQLLRSFKRDLERADADKSPAALLTEQCNDARSRLDAQLAAGRITPQEAGIHRQALSLLQVWGKSVPATVSGDDAFDLVRAGFNRQVRTREDTMAQASDALEFAFDFMERAFGEDQEMVVFVNELALGPDSAPFLAENECERFETYSRTLLLDGNQDQLMAELKRDDLRQSETSRDF